MIVLSESYLFHRIDLSKKPQYQHIKFERAFRFLRLFLLQRTYGIDLLSCSSSQLSSKHRVTQCDFDVFLGGSCNPTTWRSEQAIPYFQSRTISYYNPQVPNWTPDLVDIEHRIKESASLLFFVIDHSTRSLAAIAEVCYLAARGKNLIVVMNPMPKERNQTKFLEKKDVTNEIDNEEDYENVCAARQTLRLLLQSIDIPVFDDIHVALECAVFLIENISFNPCHFRQISSFTIESDDDGYGSSLASSHRTSSRSPSPISSDFEEYNSTDNRFSRFYLTVLQPIVHFCLYPLHLIGKHLPSSTLNPDLPYSPASPIFDLYIASGNRDEDWLNTIVFPILRNNNITYTRRDMSNEDDEIDIHIRKRSRLLYYLINDNERLSHLATELAFLIGERQHHIIVSLQSTIRDDSEEIRSKNERQDIERSRKYLADLATKEKIFLFHSREESWQHVFQSC